MRLPNVDAKMLEVHKNQSGDCQVDWNLKQVRAPKPSYVIYGTTTCTHCPFCTRTCGVKRMFWKDCRISPPSLLISYSYRGKAILAFVL